MAFINTPDLSIRSIQWTFDRPSQVNTSAWTGTRTVQTNPWHGKWAARVTLSPIVGEANVRAVRSFLARCQGQTNTFRLFATEGAQNENGAVSIAVAAVAGDSSITITGEDDPLLDGQMFTISGQLCCCTADQAGEAVQFEPPLRQDASVGTPVVTSRPYAVVYMTSASLGWSIDAGQVYGISFDVEEAILDDFSPMSTTVPIYNITASPATTGTATLAEVANGIELSAAQFNKDLLVGTGYTSQGDRMSVQAAIRITTTAGSLRVGLGLRNSAGNYLALGWQDNGWLVGRSNYGGGPSGNISTTLPTYTTGDVLDFRFEVVDDELYVTVSKNGGTRYAFGFTGAPEGAAPYFHIYDVTTAAHVTFDVIAEPGAEFTDTATILGGTIPPTSWAERLAPSGFTAPRLPAARFWKDPAARLFATNIDLRPILSEDDPTVFNQYVDIATGNDSNAGTQSAPLKSLRQALLNAGTGARTAIYAKGGLYDYANSASAGNPAAAMVQLVSWDGNPVISSMHDAGLTWTLESGSTYQATFANQVIDVYDAANLTADGDYGLLTLAASLVLCRSTANSYFISGTTVYVHTFNGRAPDASVRVYKATADGLHDHNGKWNNAGSLYLENIRFEGGRYAFYNDTNANPSTWQPNIYGRNCTFKYASAGSSPIVNGDVLAVWQQCTAALNSDDGFHYNPISGSNPATGIEIDCVGRYNGRGVSGACNNSSNHSGATIRVKTLAGYGDYHHALNRGIHDIKDPTISASALSWHLGITSRDSQSGNANFTCGSGTGAPKMWNDTCTSTGATNDQESEAGATIYYSALVRGATDTGAGAITTYTP